MIIMNPYYDQWELCELDTTVQAIKEENNKYWIGCKDSIFYVEGGGMGKDTGTINGVNVEDIKYEEGMTWHLVDEKIEGNVHLNVDIKQRRQKVQIHSAQHLMCGIMNKKYHAPTIAFFYHDDFSGIEMGFETFNESLLKQIEKEVNDYICQDLPIQIVYPTREEAQQHVKDEKLEHDELRAAVIGDIDYNMCGCIHVPSLRHIQCIKYTDFEKTSRGYRIYFVCGDQLLETYDRQLKVLKEASVNLTLPQFEIMDGIQKLRQEIKELKTSEAEWKQRVLDLRIQEYGAKEEKILVDEINDLDIKSFQSLCSGIVRQYEKAVLFVCKASSRSHVVVAAHPSLQINASVLFKQIASKYQLRGGGNPGMAQGGGEYQPEILETLKEMVKQVK